MTDHFSVTSKTALLLALVAFSPLTVKAQYVAAIASTTVGPTSVTSVAGVETDYIASAYYQPRTDGYLLINGVIALWQSQHYYGSDLCITINGVGFPNADDCLTITQAYSGVITPATTYVTQTNACVTALYPEVNSNVTYDDPFGYGLDSPEVGQQTIVPNSTCLMNSNRTDLFATSRRPTSSLDMSSLALSRLAIYGQYLDGASTVALSGTGITITSFQYYSTGLNGQSQINAFFQAAPNATSPQNVSVPTSHGTSNSKQITVQPPPTITQNPTMLWYFGPGLSPPSTFSLGDVKTTLSATASGGNFNWSITLGSTKASFASGTAKATIATTTNTVVLYSLSYSTSPGDVAVSLVWTDSSGVVHPTASYSLSIDSPFKLSLISTSPVAYVTNCVTLTTANPNYGWEQKYTWIMLSKFGLPIVGQSVNENFSNQTPVYPGENWPAFVPNGSAGVYASAQFADNYCLLNPPNHPPQKVPPPAVSAGLFSVNLVDWGYQYYAVGTTTIGGGIQVQKQTFQRYIQNPALVSIISPVRSQ